LRFRDYILIFIVPDSRDFIRIRGARVHNLKNINLDIPKNRLVVITGLSGSGKSSLAFDTLYAEGRRRYIESLSAYARQFLGQLDKPDVDKIEGLSPAIAIEQKGISRNPRSTVGTVTEIYDYLRLLFARVGQPHCPECGRPVGAQSQDQIIEAIMSLPKGEKVVILGPVLKGKKGFHKDILDEIDRQGFVRVRIDGKIMRIEEALKKSLGRYKLHDIDVVVDRLEIPDFSKLANEEKKDERTRIADSIETALKIGEGTMVVHKLNSGRDIVFSTKLACPYCGISISPIEPRSFSFNSPYGACPGCHGLGIKIEVDPSLVVPDKSLSISEGAIAPWANASHRVGRQSWFWRQLQKLSERMGFSLRIPWEDLSQSVRESILYGRAEYDFEGVIPQLARRYNETESDYTRAEIKRYMSEKPCPVCQGKRLKAEFLAVKICGQSIADIVSVDIGRALEWFQEFWRKLLKNSSQSLDARNRLEIARPVVREIIRRLQFLVDVGLEYLTLDRRSDTLAGGEAQRIQLATQIGSGLSGVLYILDEPSVGLHQRDQSRLIKTLGRLRDLGNTVIVVEHDRQMIEAADWVIDIGPKGGKDGGEVVAQGTPQQIARVDTPTGRYLRNAGFHKRTPVRSGESRKSLVIKGALEHNLKNIDVRIPLGKLVCVTGVSGSGKSSLVDDILAKALKKRLYGARVQEGKYEDLQGIENIDRAVVVDQSPIGRTPRSNPATYTGIFTFIRQLFARTGGARARGYNAGRFSFNMLQGRCENCQGQGIIRVEMQFLPDVYITCQVCKGKRFKKEVLEIEYKGKNIAEVLEMTVAQAYSFFKNIPSLEKRLGLLRDIGLDYIQLGQPAPTLSGGEAQRIKLARELTQYLGRHTLYILDEPTTGLHHFDILNLLKVLNRLVSQGNTVLVIEHNLDVISQADWIIDLGPEGGDRGGYIIAEGTPAEVAQVAQSWTGKYLKEYFKG